MNRGEIWWAELGIPAGSAPGYRHPVVILSTNVYNESRIATVVVVAITSNMRLAAAPGNVRISSRDSGLSRESVVNVSQVITIDKSRLLERVAQMRAERLAEVEEGLRRVLGL